MHNKYHQALCNLIRSDCPESHPIKLHAQMLTKKQKTLSKIKRLLRLKGGGKMSEVVKELTKTIKDVRSGKCPTKTAETIHKLGNSIAQNGYADAKLRDRGMVNEESRRIVKEHEDLTA